ncbi:MAG: hypothetical protein HY360_00805 [Verrucomicrobia bacterium]|nr:hypothetical protein [Verrucomicrobiota bacterium]
MKTNLLALIALQLLLNETNVMGINYYLKEPLDQVPTAATVEKPDQVKVIAGRRDNAKALLIEGGSVTWALKEVGEDVLIEFWMKPEKWDSRSSAAVPVASFTIGNATYRLEKPANQAELQLARDSKVLQSYPIYDWIPQPWMEKTGRDMWHYVFITVTRESVAFSVDGFTARRLNPVRAEGALNRIQLQGAPGTAFANLHVIGSRPLIIAEIRNRYRCHYRCEPELYKNTVTVPTVSRPPKIDGRLEPGEWDGAATLVGFTRLRGQSKALNGDPITAYIAYDQRYLYLAIRTPYKGTLDAKDWKGQYDMPLYSEESYEIFIHPPYTGTPDFCQLIGNPYSNQCDLKMLNLAWNGRWDWKASIQDGEWIAECRVDFKGCDMPQPKAGAVWTMNMVNTPANAGWCFAMAYNDANSFGIIRFEDSPAIIRPQAIEVTADAIRVPMDILGGKKAHDLNASLQTYGPTDVLPAREAQKTVRIASGGKQRIDLETSIKGLEKGLLAISVREGETQLYYHQVGFPSTPPEIRQGSQAAAPSESKPAAAQPTNPSQPATEEEKAYARKWTAEELGDELLNSAKWQNNQLGIATDVPKPWTPMRVNGPTIECWERSYEYRDSALPVQVTSRGEKLFAAPPRVVLTKNQKRFVFEKATVQIKLVNDGLVRVETVSQAGPYEVQIVAEYEFDGMAKIDMKLANPEGGESADGLALEFPIKPQHSSLFHITASTSGHPPATDSGFVPKEGMKMDEFRELVWLGDHTRGFCWFAESLENWPIKDENGIEVIEPARDGARLLRIKLADRPFTLGRPLALVFGFQATPTRPRPDNFRFLADFNAMEWCWFWGDGPYTIWQSLPDRAREQIQTARTKGREVMPCSSLMFYGQHHFAKSLFGDIPNPGLINREAMLWGPLWSATTIPTEVPRVPERHTAPGEWYGKKFEPGGLDGYCPASDFQNYYLWRLNDLIQKTSLGGLYLDQPAIRCSNAHHHCGYVNYRGQWTPRLPLFAMRQMIKRINRLFYDAHGKTFIRWHCSNQILVPVMSFINIYWDGENYASGPLRVSEFYSKLLNEGRLQTQHTGVPFGFAPDLLPEFDGAYAPTPASVRDMMGLFMIHDSTSSPAHSAHDALIRFLQDKRFGVDLANKQVLYYWNNDPRLKVSPATVKPILHFSPDGGLLVLFNWSDDPVDADVRLDPAGLGLGGNLAVRDLVSETEFPVKDGTLRLPILPRDLRMLQLKSK